MKPPREIIELDEEELRVKLNQIEAVMGSEIASPFRRLLEGYITVLVLLREKKISIDRLRKLVFGGSSERSSEIMPEEENPSKSETEAGGEASLPVEDPAAEHESHSSSESTASSNSVTGNDKKDPKRPGHGRNPADAYTGCNQVAITHDCLCPGDDCPDCERGTVYRQSEWSPVVRLKGQPPVGGTVYRLERLRCHLCGKVHTAELPEEAGSEKYDPTVSSIIAMLRYGEGFPWNRIQRIQKFAGVPLPASTQWKIV